MDRSIDKFPPAPPRTPYRTYDPPPPGPLAERLALAAVEILHGFRPVRQMQEWMLPGLYRKLADKTGQLYRCGSPTRRPGRIMSSRTCVPAHGICEATVVVHDSLKPRACALRLELIRNKWKVSALDVV